MSKCQCGDPNCKVGILENRWNQSIFVVKPKASAVHSDTTKGGEQCIGHLTKQKCDTPRRIQSLRRMEVLLTLQETMQTVSET